MMWYFIYHQRHNKKFILYWIFLKYILSVCVSVNDSRLLLLHKWRFRFWFFRLCWLLLKMKKMFAVYGKTKFAWLYFLIVKCSGYLTNMSILLEVTKASKPFLPFILLPLQTFISDWKAGHHNRVFFRPHVEHFRKGLAYSRNIF